jgi:enoyl-CoA hydratase/carnithine racemase
MTSYEQVQYDVSDGIGTVTLARPDKLNAFTPIMREELVDAFNRSDADDNVRVVIVTGAGRAFCAGADLAMFDYERKGATVGDVPRDGGGQVSLRIFESHKPVIAAINGAAVGVGLTMTLPMDIRLVSDTAKLGFVFSRRGNVPEAASTWFLPRIVGPSRAAEWFCSGRVFDAAEALEGGLVRSVHPSSQLLDAATSLAREIADNTAQVSVALSRQLLWRGLSFDSPYQSHVAESRALQFTGRSADVREGVASFLEKRPATFVGRVSMDVPDVFSDPQPAWAETLVR